jgi:hypothetical protein
VCAEESTLTQDTNVNSEPHPIKKSIRLNVSNETPRDVRVRGQVVAAG